MTSSPTWASAPGVKLVTGDFDGNGLTDMALVQPDPGWGSIPIAFANRDGGWNIANGPSIDSIQTWASPPGVKLVAGDFTGNGLADLALVPADPGLVLNTGRGSSDGDGGWTITDGGRPDWSRPGPTSPASGPSQPVPGQPSPPTERRTRAEGGSPGGRTFLSH